DEQSMRGAKGDAGEQADGAEDRRASPGPRPAEHRVLLVELDEGGLTRCHVGWQRATQWMAGLLHRARCYRLSGCRGLAGRVRGLPWESVNEPPGRTARRYR